MIPVKREKRDRGEKFSVPDRTADTISRLSVERARPASEATGPQRVPSLRRAAGISPRPLFRAAITARFAREATKKAARGRRDAGETGRKESR
jgi:hypothetical protein